VLGQPIARPDKLDTEERFAGLHRETQIAFFRGAPPVSCAEDSIAVDVQPPISDNEGDNDDDTSEGSEEARLALATNHASVVEGDSTNRSGQA